MAAILASLSLIPTLLIGWIVLRAALLILRSL